MRYDLPLSSPADTIHRTAPSRRNNMKQLPLSQGKFALLDDDDYDHVCHFRWFYRPEHLDQGYAIRHGRKTDPTQTVYLHREIMAPPNGYQVRFLNRDHLDCRK